MLRTAVTASALIALVGLSAGTPVKGDAMAELSYPETRRLDIVEDHFGEMVADPYRWLENDARSDPEVAGWVAAQNAVTDAYLGTLPGRDILQQRLTALFDYAQFTVPVVKGNLYFYTKNPGTDNQPTLYVRDGVDGADRVLIDPNGWSEDGATALAEWSVSGDGAFIAYAVQDGGTDARTIKVLDVATGDVLDDDVQGVRFVGPSWARDGFFYLRFPTPEGGASAQAAVANGAIYFHAVGTAQSDDRLVYATPDQPYAQHFPDVTLDERYALIYSLAGSGTNGLTFIDLDSDDWAPRILIADFEEEWSVAGNDGSKLFVITTTGAERRELVMFDLADADPVPVDLIAQDAAVLSGAWVLGGRLLVSYLVDAKTEVRRYMLDGTADGVIALPGIGSAGGFRGSLDSDEAFFIYSSYVAPMTVYRYDVASNTSTVWVQPEVPVDLDTISVEQRFCTSKDGTRVPMFIIRRKDVTGPAPTMLYGYGGFSISMVPVYNPAQIAWIEQGGVFVVANIRGGAEYGRVWHMAGQLENKQNVFDDFIAAAEFLRAEGITTEHGLAIQGESNGGLLIGAVTNQRPDLFDVALPGVGVMDMLRFNQFTGGQFWVSDFGDPGIEAQFRTLLAYSPYHNVRSSGDYPAILATTADADDRVIPGHTFKYIAAIQAADIGPAPHLVRIETRAGHGAGKPLDKVIAEVADMWAFAAYWTDLTITPQ